MGARIGIALLFLTAALAIFNISTSKFHGFVPPMIEQWPEKHFNKDSNVDPSDKQQLVIKWYSNPQESRSDGMVIYHKSLAFIKAWNLRVLPENDAWYYDLSKVRVALLDDNGNWCLGDIGERLKTHRTYGPTGETMSVTYTFDGNHSYISKTIKL